MPTTKPGPKRPACKPATSGDVARRKGGRPPNSTRHGISQQDAAIAEAVATMWAFGIPRRDACKAVAAAASTLWAARDLTADGVEAIHERCSDACGTGKPPKLGRYALNWRRAAGRRHGLAELAPVDAARMLLLQGGRRPPSVLGEDEVFQGDAPLTAGAHREYMSTPRLKIKKG